MCYPIHQLKTIIKREGSENIIALKYDFVLNLVLEVQS